MLERKTNTSMMEQENETPDPTYGITSLSADEIARYIREGKLSAREAVMAHIERIEVVNPMLNALVAPRFEQALSEADAADAALARDESVGLLHGVPITIKDQFMIAGLATTWGLPSRVTDIDREDGPLVRRLKDAGAIILGKTNVPQLLAYHESENPLYGQTNNPWNLERTPGGSSGGEASIIAARGSALGLGADIGGSIRIPAHFCGLHGLKPTTGRLTNLDSPVHLFPFGQETVQVQPGPIARSVADIALAMDLLAAPGQQKIDPTIAPVTWNSSYDGPLNGLKIAMYTDDGFFPAAPAVRRAVREAAHALEERGAIIEEWSPPNVLEIMQIFVSVLAADGGGYIKRTVNKDPYDFHIKGFLRLVNIPNFLRPSIAFSAKSKGQLYFADLIRHVHGYSADGYMQLIVERNRYRTNFQKELEAGSFDAIICPPHALLALKHGGSYTLNIAGSYSILYNVLGLPAGVVAATCVKPDEESDQIPSVDGFIRAARDVEAGSTGLPVSVQVVSHAWREDIVLKLMAALELYFRAQKDYPLRSSR
jgi:fatty acid amide hydrolase